MKRTIPCLCCLLLLSGCPPRVSSYSPRLNDTAQHRAALEKKNCRDCHDPARIRDHKADDECTRCHILCRGC